MQQAYGATTLLLATDSEDAASEVLASLSVPIKVDDTNDILPAMNVVQVLYDRRRDHGRVRRFHLCARMRTRWSVRRLRLALPPTAWGR